jgi:paraquat-inducible protein B
VTKIVIRSYEKDFKAYIPVFIEVFPQRFEVIGEDPYPEDLEESLKKLIEKGLRAQLVTQSMITGRLLIEVNMHPNTPVVMKNLDEGYKEIPTIPSTLARLGKSLEKLDLQEISARLTSILTSVDRTLKNLDIGASLRELKGVLQDARGLVEHVDAKVDPLADNLNNTIRDADKLLNNVDGEVTKLSIQAKTALDDIGKLARDVNGQVDPLSKSVTDALSAVESAFKSIDGLVGEESATRADLDKTLQELAGAARSLRLLAEYLERHPDSLLKGKGYKAY